MARISKMLFALREDKSNLIKEKSSTEFTRKKDPQTKAELFTIITKSVQLTFLLLCSNFRVTDATDFQQFDQVRFLNLTEEMVRTSWPALLDKFLEMENEHIFKKYERATEHGGYLEFVEGESRTAWLVMTMDPQTDNTMDLRDIPFEFIEKIETKSKSEGYDNDSVHTFEYWTEDDKYFELAEDHYEVGCCFSVYTLIEVVKMTEQERQSKLDQNAHKAAKLKKFFSYLDTQYQSFDDEIKVAVEDWYKKKQKEKEAAEQAAFEAGLEEKVKRFQGRRRVRGSVPRSSSTPIAEAEPTEITIYTAKKDGYQNNKTWTKGSITKIPNGQGFTFTITPDVNPGQKTVYTHECEQITLNKASTGFGFFFSGGSKALRDQINQENAGGDNKLTDKCPKYENVMIGKSEYTYMIAVPTEADMETLKEFVKPSVTVTPSVTKRRLLHDLQRLC